MKTSLLLIFALVFGIAVSAQKVVTKQSATAKPDAALFLKQTVDETTNFSTGYIPGYQPANTFNRTPGVTEALIGNTRYDNQSNASVQNRIYAYPDGTIAATWIFGVANPGFSERGTGYNYFNGVEWQAEPTARIENARCGWPSYAPLGDGEIVVTHNGSTAALITTRPTRGTGAWTTTQLVGPTVGGTALLWPRVMTSGNTVHLLACTDDGTYMGLSRALVYYRSTDGATTFTGPTILPGMDAAALGVITGGSFSGLDGDAYNFAAPKGDTVAFVFGDQMGGLWVMKSFDAGLTWEKVTVFTVPVTTTAPYDIFASHDNSMSMALDSEGKAHVVFGRMRASDDNFAVAGNSYYPYTDGLIYWNETMPQLDTAQLNSYDLLEANGNLLATMQDYNNNGEIDFPEVGSGEFAFGLYGSSLTSMAQMVIDKDDNIFVSYSSCREDLINSGAAPNTQLYRHLYMISKMNGSEWSEPRDLTDDIEHSYDECVYASLSYTTNDMLHLVYQLDPEPGTAVGSDVDPYGDNYLNYLTFPTFVGLKPATIVKDVKISPNPATQYADVQVSVIDNTPVNIQVYDATGRMVISNNYGKLNVGTHVFRVNTQLLPSGIYMFTIQTGTIQTTKKVIKK